jgi:hypothetical protein
MVLSKAKRSKPQKYLQERLYWVMIEKDVVPIGPQAGMTAKELPDLIQSRTPRRADRALCHLAPQWGMSDRFRPLFSQRTRICRPC